ncbi:hypothetical protein ACTMU2_41145 [Cupriavidus basilensis]
MLRSRYGERAALAGPAYAGCSWTMSSIVSSTIINVAIPDLSRHSRAGQERAQWVAASFMIAMTPGHAAHAMATQHATDCGARVPGRTGAAGRRGTGRRAVAHLWRDDRNARGRGRRGRRSAQPLPNILVLRVFEEREQGKAMSLFGFGVVLAPALGPEPGRLPVEAFGWRSISSWWCR